MKSEVIATIELDNNEGRGELYWSDGTIHCRRAKDGEEWDTGLVSSKEDAAQAIDNTWGNGFWSWDLQWEDEA